MLCYIILLNVILSTINSKEFEFKISETEFSQTGQPYNISSIKPGKYTIIIAGANGGTFNEKYEGGRGVEIKGILEVKKEMNGEAIVGKPGQSGGREGLPGGGGGSFLYFIDGSSKILILVAGGGGGGCTIRSKQGIDGSTKTSGADSSPTEFSEPTCIGKGGIDGKYGSYAESCCGKQKLGGLGGAWFGNPPNPPSNTEASGSGSGPNGNTPFIGGKGIFSGGYGGGGGGGVPNEGGSGSGGGYSGGGTGFSAYSCGGGGGSFISENIKLEYITISKRKGGYLEIRAAEYNGTTQPSSTYTTKVIMTTNYVSKNEYNGTTQPSSTYTTKVIMTTNYVSKNAMSNSIQPIIYVLFGFFYMFVSNRFT